jgi:uncharacterized membrane protein YqjE
VRGVGLRKKLRIASLIMLIIAIVFVAFAFMSMDVPIAYPTWLRYTLQVIYKVYPILMVLLFLASFFVKEKEKK